MIEKICSSCGLSKYIEDFYRNSSCADGHGSWCKECSKESDRIKDAPLRIKKNERLRRIKETNFNKISHMIVRSISPIDFEYIEKFEEQPSELI